MLLTTYWSTT